jgi:two-component system, NarL family, invasion response regulator UvrY
MSKVPVRIILVDDHKIVREAWKMMLGHYPGFTIIAECDTGETAIAQAEKLKPDIMLIDVNMAPMNGFTTTKRILEKNPAIKIIAMSVNNEPKYASKMIELGAKGYLTKTSPVDEINKGILKVINGEIYICEEIKRKML